MGLPHTGPPPYPSSSTEPQVTWFPNVSVCLSISILCAFVLCLHVCLHEDVGSPGTGVEDSCEMTRGCWKLGPLEE